MRVRRFAASTKTSLCDIFWLGIELGHLVKFRTTVNRRLTHFFLPVIGFSAAMTILYSALDWLLIAHPDMLPVDEEVVQIWLPLVFCGLFVALLVLPRLSEFRLDQKRKLNFVYGIAAFVVVLAPTLVAQFYVKVEAGSVAQVEDASDIASAPSSKYYLAKHVCLARGGSGAQPRVEPSGRNHQDLNFHLFVAVPVCSTGAGDLRTWPLWIGFQYRDSISNRRSTADKETAFKRFLSNSERLFNAENPSTITYLERSGPSRDRRDWETALRRTGNTADHPLILIPHTGDFAKRSGSRLQWAAGLFFGGALVWLVMVLIPRLDETKRRRERDARAREYRQIISGMLFLPTKENYGLPVLLDVNIGVFLVMVFAGLGVVSFDTQDLLRWGANFAPDLHGAGLLRLISSQFVHAGLMHLASNMYGLLFAGFFLLPIARNWQLIGCYLLCGIGGGILSALMSPTSPSVGASGSIFGLFGILLVLAALDDQRIRDANLRTFILVNGGIFAALNLLMGAATPGIDNAAHIGGLATGGLLGALMFLQDRKLPRPTRRAASERNEGSG